MLPREAIRRAGELHAEYIKRGGKRKRILPDFIIGAYAEYFAEIFVTWNTEDFKLKIPVKTVPFFASIYVTLVPSGAKY